MLVAITFQNNQYKHLSAEANEHHLRAASIAADALGYLIWIDNLLLTNPATSYSLDRDLTTYQQLFTEEINELLTLEASHGHAEDSVLVEKLHQQWHVFKTSTDKLGNEKPQIIEAFHSHKPGFLLTLRQLQRDHDVAYDDLTNELAYKQRIGALTIVILIITALLIGGVVSWLVIKLIYQSLDRQLQAEQNLKDYRDHLEMLVQLRTRELEKINKELEAFSYSVSHDLRTPLRAIDGFSQILIEDYGDELDVQGNQYLERVRNAAQRMGKLIDDLLSLSHINRASFEPEVIDLSFMADKILTNLSSNEKNRSVEIDIANDLTCTGDAGLIRIALENLFNNAWKYTSKTADALIRFDAEHRDGEIVFCVSDNGVGFDMKHSGKLFTAFHRLHGEKEFQGTGIGLATVARIIHRHGGKIWANAKLGKGAAFYFTVEE